LMVYNGKTAARAPPPARPDHAASQPEKNAP
jgi:hypothetical protein